MVLRTARKGPKAGKQFWGCSKYPNCRESRNYDDVSPLTQHVGSPSGGSKLSVEWREGVRRADFNADYVSVAAMPSILPEALRHDDRLQQVLGQCVLLLRRARARTGTTDARTASSLLLKMLRRGHVPLPTLRVEREAISVHGLLDQVKEFDEVSPELGWECQPSARKQSSFDAIMATATRRGDFVLDPVFCFDSASEQPLLQSEEEELFLTRWVPHALGPTAGHWFTPQAPLDLLLESAGATNESGARRVDFLFSHPGGSPLVVEIDGPEHRAAERVDDARDKALHSIGVAVSRVPNDEVRSGRGPALDRIRRHCRKALEALSAIADADKNMVAAAIDCATAAKVQYAIGRAVGFGWLTAANDWAIYISGAGAVAIAGVRDLLELLTEFDALYGMRAAPASCQVRADDQLVTLRRTNNNEWVPSTEASTAQEQVSIIFEPEVGPFHKRSGGMADFVIRPAHVPVPFATEQPSELRRRAITAKTYSEVESTLTTFLQIIFRKRRFREQQGEAVFNVLRQQDCVVLLPTGAGKSIIYQLAGILMPGLTLVVAPINALIEDQIDGLHAYGVDRAVGVTGDIAGTERERLLRRVERGEYLFVLHAPERLQSPQFRSTLRALVECSFINLAVIDEAHCVSEWGHDFRPAYLNLANNLRRLAADRDGKPPPLLALTGTASRKVLKDMLIDLGIDRTRSDALIRPRSFDRSEISFEVVRTSPREDPRAALRGVLNRLPGFFGLPRSEFYQPCDRQTASGIVFVPFVNGWHGIKNTSEVVRRTSHADVTIYSGRPPHDSDASTWNATKRDNAAAFKQNRVPILVATKAFGMGIDKPNIRYTIHFGMPMSLESFYQEAGRAGRDQKPARAVIVFSEYDESRSDRLLDSVLALDRVRAMHASEADDRTTSDDVTGALWFHLKNFSGVKQETDEVRRVVDAIPDLTTSHRLELPHADADQNLHETPRGRGDWRSREDARTRREKAIDRLVKLGIIHDYEVDYGGQKFIVYTGSFDAGHCRARLLDYVHAATPGKVDFWDARVKTTDPTQGRSTVMALAELLIEFTYEEIEASRRRSIQEALLLARRARSDAEIRGRLLDYLQEGIGAEQIEQLLEAERVELSAWWNLIGRVQTAMEAGELRGLCIRALESYPDHPGLALTRAVSEAMCSDHDDGVSSNGVGIAIDDGIDKYGISQIDIASTVERMFGLAATERGRGLGPPLTKALFEIVDARSDCAFVEPIAVRRAAALDHPGTRSMAAERRLRHMIDELGKAADGAIRSLETTG